MTGATGDGDPTEPGPIERRAAVWTVRLAGEPLRVEEQRELEAWLAADPRHVGALVRARARWVDLDRLGALAGAAAVGGSAASPPEDAPILSRRGLIAAGLGAAGMLAVGWSVLAPAGEYYASAVGEVRRIPLADGSMLVLNTNSRARVRYERDRREVRLLQGEALFEVAHDGQRPFIVHSADWQVRAVGTVFAVRVRGTEVDVTVSQGTVELDDARQPEAEPRRITASEQTVLTPSSPIRVEKLAPAVLQRRFAWLNGMVAYSGESLAAAVEEINRHNRQQIIIDDPALGQQPIVGAFRASDAPAFAAAAAAALGAEAVTVDGVLHLRTASRPALHPAQWGK